MVFSSLTRLKWVLVLSAFSAIGACSNSDDGGTGEFIGVYMQGFEASSFHECGGTERWWADAPIALMNDLYRLDAPVAGSPEPPGRAIRVRLHGHVSSRGHYGHLGQYRRQLFIDAVVESAALDATVCTACQPAGWSCPKE